MNQSEFESAKQRSTKILLNPHKTTCAMVKSRSGWSSTSGQATVTHTWQSLMAHGDSLSSFVHFMSVYFQFFVLTSSSFPAYLPPFFLTSQFFPQIFIFSFPAPQFPIDFQLILPSPPPPPTHPPTYPPKKLFPGESVAAELLCDLVLLLPDQAGHQTLRPVRQERVPLVSLDLWVCWVPELLPIVKLMCCFKLPFSAWFWSFPFEKLFPGVFLSWAVSMGNQTRTPPFWEFMIVG